MDKKSSFIFYSKKLIRNNVVKNGIWLYILQLFNTVVPLISLPYITRILGKENYGVFSFSLNIIEYFIVVVEYGFNYSGTRKVALALKKDELQEIFLNIIFARFFLFVLCFGGLNIFLHFSIMNHTQIISCYILFLSVFGVVLQQTWLFQGLQKMYYITIFSIISRTLSVCLIFKYVLTADDILIYCFLYSVTPVMIGIMGIIFSIKLLYPFHYKFNLKKIINEIKTGWYTFTTSLSSKIFSAVGITILGFVSSKDQVGIFSAIHKIPTLLLLLWTPISQVLYPISSQKMKNNPKEGQLFINKLKKFFSLFFLIVSLIICIFAKLIINLAFGEEYSEYYYILYPLIIWLNLGILNNFSGIQTLLAGGYDKTYSKCFQISVIITIILNIILINIWKITGASIAPMLSEFILFLMLHFSIKQINRSNNL